MRKSDLSYYRQLYWDKLLCQECESSSGPFAIHTGDDGCEILCISCFTIVIACEQEPIDSGKKKSFTHLNRLKAATEEK